MSRSRFFSKWSTVRSTLPLIFGLLSVCRESHVAAQQGSPHARPPTQLEITHAETTLAQNPESVPALTTLAELRFRQGHEQSATDLLHRALELSPSAPAPNLLLGDMLLSGHHLPEAMERFETVLSVDPHQPAARRGELAAASQIALAAMANRDPDAALHCLEHARVSLPDDPTLLLELGADDLLLQKYDEAHEALAASLALRPHNAAALNAIALAETQQNKYPQAEAHLRAYMALQPNDQLAHFKLGHLLVHEERLPEAQAELRRSIALEPDQAESYYELAQIATDDHRDAAAKPLLQRTLAKDPKHGGALTCMGILAFREKKYAEARQYLEQAVAVAPMYGPARYNLGQTLTRLGDRQAAEAQFAALREISHDVQMDKK